MSGLEGAGLGWLAAGCFALMVISAVVPCVNAELVVLSLPVVAPSRHALLLLVLVATAGQMIGKLMLYWTARRTGAMGSVRVTRALDRWRPHLAGSGRKSVAIVALSSAVGVPPFFVTTILAGAVGMRVGPFIAAGTCGRLFRFSVLVLVPHAVMNGWWSTAV
jgi:membrane protein YqaA with SNARE-associated domain